MTTIVRRLAASFVAVALAFTLVGTAPATARPADPASAVRTPDGKLVTGRPLDAGVQALKSVPGRPGELDRVSTGGMSTLAATYRLYNVGSQAPPTPANVAGVGAAMKIGGHQGALNGATDNHTLTEMAVQSSDTLQTIEVGAIQSPSVNGGSYGPRPFVFFWVNGVAQCYNGCGFVSTSTTIVPGVTTLTAGQLVSSVGIWHDDAQAVWWIWWGSEWIGYYPDALFPVSFTRVGFYQLFGEIASTEQRPCSDMGHGYPPSNTANASRFSSTTFYNASYASNSTDVDLYIRPVPAMEAGSPYAGVATPNVPPAKVRSFYFGGPMWNAAGTAVGTRGQPC